MLFALPHIITLKIIRWDYMIIKKYSSNVL